MATTKKRPSKDLASSHDSSAERSRKRRKTKAALPVADDKPSFSHSPQKPRLPASSPSAETANPTMTTSSEPPAEQDNLSDVLPSSLRHLQSRYIFATMSIISSAKITQKVRSLRAHLEKFSFADLKAKPGVVALHAKANVASKMISVVEIFKREVEKEGGHVYQYSQLESLLQEMKEKKPKTEKKAELPVGEVRTLGEWQTAQEDGAEVSLQLVANDVEMEDQDKMEDEEAFESMTGKGLKDQLKVSTSEARKKIRATPVLTIYLSRVPVPELKELYG